MPLKKLQDRQGLKLRDDGGALFYTVGKDAYYVQCKKINYKLIDKDPLTFIESIVTPELLMIKAHALPLKKGEPEQEVTYHEFT